MPKSGSGKRAARTAFLAMGLTLAVATIATFAYLGSDWFSRKTTTSNISIVFSEEPIQVITLDLNSGNIRLRVGKGTEVTGTRKIRSGRKTPTYSERRGPGGVLTLASNCPDSSPFCSVDYDLMVPANVQINRPTGRRIV
jgi:hypothetical protein